MTFSWLPIADLASLNGVNERTARRWIDQGRYAEWRRVMRGRNTNAIEVAITSLSEDERSKLFPPKPLLSLAAEQLPQPIPAFETASENQQRRAAARRAAVVGWDQFVEQWGGGKGLTRAKQRWVEQYAAGHRGFERLSVDSIERWSARFQAYGIDGLVDRNDGSARRGKSVLPKLVRAIFTENLCTGNVPTIAEAIQSTRYQASDNRIAIEHIADDAFYRFAARIPEIRRRATGEDQDKLTSYLPSVRRDYTSLRAMEVVQSDHHIADVWVRCDSPECQHGHRPWVTVWMDVRSRKVLAWIAAIDYPNSRTILKSFRELVEEYGIPGAVYIDNGKDYRKAFAKRDRTWGGIDGAAINNLVASLGMKATFAIAYHPQSKTIERLFGTWVTQMWRGSEAYVGRLGKRTEKSDTLFNDPQQLPSVDEFRDVLDSKIVIYNTTRGHRGQGMAGGSPDEVFAATRLPFQQPDEKSFALCFWDYEVRMVRGAAFSIGGYRYRLLKNDVAYEYEGKYVQILIDPDDQRRAFVLTGCVHCKPEVRRDKTVRCSCAGKGQFLCEAELWVNSTFSFDDPVTVENKKTVQRLHRDFKARMAAGDPRAREIVRRWNGPAYLARLAAMRRKEMQPLVAAAGEGRTTFLLPHSKIARDAEAMREVLSNPCALTSDQIALADSVVDRTDEFLDEVSRAPRALRAVPPSEDDPIAFDAELMRVREERERKRKAAAGECLDCPAPRSIGKYCENHWPGPLTE
jgi:putative transposase